MTERVSFACANSFALSHTAFGCVGAWCVVHFWLHRPSPSPSHMSSTRAPTTCSSITPIAPHAGLPFAHLPSSPPPSFNISECGVVCVVMTCAYAFACHIVIDAGTELLDRALTFTPEWTAW